MKEELRIHLKRYTSGYIVTIQRNNDGEWREMASVYRETKTGAKFWARRWARKWAKGKNRYEETVPLFVDRKW